MGNIHSQNNISSEQMEKGMYLLKSCIYSKNPEKVYSLAQCMIYSEENKKLTNLEKKYLLHS